jgi:hypothetical protein
VWVSENTGSGEGSQRAGMKLKQIEMIDGKICVQICEGRERYILRKGWMRQPPPKWSEWKEKKRGRDFS